MTISQMRYFQEVCRHRNVTKAAAALHVSQPSVSNAIRELESELGINLFHRVKMRLSPTQEGSYFLEKVTHILREIDALAEDMREFGQGHNKIRIGVPSMIGTFLYPAIFDQFHTAYPDIGVEMVEHGSLRIREMVLEEELDIALAIADVKKDAGFDGVSILRTTLEYCVDKSHHLAGRREISLEDLQGEPLILFQNGSYQNQVLMERFAQLEIRPNILMYSSQLYTIKRMLFRGKAGAFLFRHVVAMEEDLVGIPLADPLEMEISLIWKKDRHIYSDTTKFISLVKQYYRRQGP